MLGSDQRNKTITKVNINKLLVQLKKRLYRAKKKKKVEMRQKESTRKKKCRKSIMKKQVTGFANPENPTEILKDVFKIRTSKHRALKD